MIIAYGIDYICILYNVGWQYIVFTPCKYYCNTHGNAKSKCLLQYVIMWRNPLHGMSNGINTCIASIAVNIVQQVLKEMDNHMVMGDIDYTYNLSKRRLKHCQNIFNISNECFYS